MRSIAESAGGALRVLGLALKGKQEAQQRLDRRLAVLEHRHHDRRDED
jgi:hypothetical protein